MSEAYRLKLLRWLTSMIVLLLFAILIACYRWFIAVPEQLQYIVSDPNPDFVILPMAGAVGLYMLGFVPLLLWHLGDLMQMGKSGLPYARLFDRYRYIFGCLCAVGLSSLLIETRFLDSLGCSEPILPKGVFRFDGCGSSIPEWKLKLSIGIFITFISLVIGKMAHCLGAYFNKSR
jgi:hypothetical protein